MREIPICLLMGERFLEEPPTTMIPSLFFKSLAMIFPTSAAFFRLRRQCRVIDKNKIRHSAFDLFIIPVQAKVFRQHLLALCISHEQFRCIPHL